MQPPRVAEGRSEHRQVAAEIVLLVTEVTRGVAAASANCVSHCVGQEKLAEIDLV